MSKEKKNQISHKPTHRATAPQENAIAKGVTYGIHCKNAENAENKQTWEELEAMYEKASRVIIDIAKTISEFIAIKEVRTELEKNPETVIRVNGINNDLMRFTRRLTTIHNKHIGKIGIISNAHELTFCLSIAEDYIRITEEFAILFSNATEIAKMVQSVFQKLEADTNNELENENPLLENGHESTN